MHRDLGAPETPPRGRISGALRRWELGAHRLPELLSPTGVRPPLNAWFCRDGARSATRAKGPVGGSNLALGAGHTGRPRGLRGPTGYRRPLLDSHRGAASWRHRTYNTLMLLILAANW